MKARRLEVGGTTATAQRLADRVDDRFQGRGINRIARELVAIGQEIEEVAGVLSSKIWQKIMILDVHDR